MAERMCRACGHRPADLGLEYCWSCRARGADCADPEPMTVNTFGGDEMPEDTKAEKPSRPGLAGKLVELLEAAAGKVVPLNAITEALYGEPWEKGSVTARRLHQVVYAATHKGGARIECVKGQGYRWIGREVPVDDDGDPLVEPAAHQDEPRDQVVVRLEPRQRHRPVATPAPEMSEEAGTMAVRDRLDLVEALVHTGTLFTSVSDPMGGRRCALAAVRILRQVGELLGVETEADGRESA